ncbi:MAG: hypothetical protein AAB874_05630 [Patescibacteria group bacterium]
MVNIGKLGYFTGEYRHNLTEKNRVSLPKRFRVEIEGDEVILSKGQEGCIEGFDRFKWQDMVKIYLTVPFTDEKGREMRRRVFSSAQHVELDKQGRMVLPEQMLVWAGLNGKVGEPVIVVGVGDHFELWEEAKWQQKSLKIET